MYCPTAFREDRPSRLVDLIREWPLGALVTVVGGAPEADLLPFDIAGPENAPVLRTHLALANPQIARLEQVDEVLVTFQGPQAYVSPSWYPSKAEDGRVVPTWNYVFIEARGTPRLVRDPVWLGAQIGALTDRMEAGSMSPWSVADAPDAFVARQTALIVGLEISTLRLAGKVKISQNRSAADRQSVRDHLTPTHTVLANLIGSSLEEP